MERRIESKAIVLNGRDIGESHRLLTLFTLELGKLKVMAYGAKRSKRRFQNALEPFTYGAAQIKPCRNETIHTLEAFAPMDTFPEIRREILKYTCAGLACELVELWTRENNREKELFDLLTWFLGVLGKGQEPYRITLFFKARLLAIVGYGPDWARFQGSTHHISLATLKSLAYIQAAPMEKIERLRIARPHMREAWALLKAMHTRHLEKEPNSYNVLRQMAQGGLQPH